MYDINKRINELNIPTKLFYDSARNEKQFIKEILDRYPTLKYGYDISYVRNHLHTVYYGFVIEDKVREAIEPNYNVNSKLDLDFNYTIDIFVDDKVAIQVKSVKYLDKELKVIKHYLDTIRYKIDRLDVSTNDYLFVFYDSHDGNRLYCITYEKLYMIIDGLVNLITEVQPSDKLYYSFYRYKHCFNDIGFIDSPSLEERLKELIDKIKEP